MKCELCHQKDAETAILLVRDGDEQELYVCRECANRERVRRQQKSQRTRKATGLPPGISVSISQVGPDVNPPPIVEAIMDAVSGMVSDLQKAEREKDVRKEPELVDFPFACAEPAYRFGEYLHLEGLHLIGELEAVHRAARALGMKLVGIDADGVRDAGHVFKLRHSGPSERARRVAEDVLAQERNARVRLFNEMRRVFGDSLCRALAILKNCRLLSPGELFDLLSPMRLAAQEKMLDGIELAEIERMLGEVDLTSREDNDTPEERDRADADRADRMNARFADVVLNERAEGKFL